MGNQDNLKQDQFKVAQQENENNWSPKSKEGPDGGQLSSLQQKANAFAANQAVVQHKKEEDEDSKKTQLKKEGEKGTSIDRPTQMKKASSSTTGMPEEVQSKMENSFETDFSSVNIHKDSSSATDMGALAYAQGNDVHFAPGQYNPNSQSGQELLGHELTHVVQQRQGRVQGSQNKGGDNINSDPELEKEADIEGEKAARGEKTTVQRKASYSIQKSDDVTPEETPEETYTVSIDGDNIKIKLGDGEESETNTKTLTKDVTQLRTWLISKYNWNAIVGIMKYCSENDTNFTYSTPTDLGGVAADNSKIMPNDGLKSIVRLQLDNKIESLESGLVAANYATILSAADGLPGTSFATGVMGEDSKNALMNESDNTNMTDESGNTIDVPDMNESEDTLYDFFRDITLAKNGLWSDNENITNVTSLRRKLDTNVTQYNDTIAVCWTSGTGTNITKHAKLYSSTTEPGEINNHRKLVAQTLTMQLGYHSGRQPAGRTSQALIQNSGNSDTMNFNAGDTTMNFHHGGNSGVNILGMTGGGLSTDYISTEESEFKTNLLFTEAFRILTQWGKKQNVKAYDYLKEWKEAKKIEFEKIEEGQASFKQEGDENATEKSVATIKEYIANKYYTTDEKKQVFMRIMQSVDSSFTEPENLTSLDKEGIKALIEDKHVEGILKKQMAHTKTLSDVDGMPGGGYIDILDGDVTSFEDMKTKATTDFTAIETVFTSIKAELGDTVGATKITYLKGLKPGTLKERDLIEGDSNIADENDDESTAIEQNVGAWSEGCQVVFGPEQFYEFWDHTTNKAGDSDQRRWYYNLIESDMLVTTEQGAE